jgi:hypothetical protein
MASLADKVSVSKDVLVSEVENEAVLLNQATGKYFTLDEIGTRIWKLIVQHGQLAQVHQAMLAEYDVDPQQLEQDLLTLTDKLVANALLQIDAS